MSRPIERALQEIIPRLSGPLPPELVELASSLLAQSRSKISNLKAEEELGRAFACANIACERLKTSLDLPKLEPRPPLAPRVYSKLYAHFDRELASSGRKRTRNGDAKSEPTRALPEKHAPSKAKSLEGFRTNRAPKRSVSSRGTKKDDRLPHWVGPMIRMLCKEMDAGKAVPHVIAGVESVLFLPCPGPEDGDGDQETSNTGEEKVEGKMPALVAAVFSFVKARLSDTTMSKKEYNAQLKQILRALNDLREDGTMLARIGKEEENWEGWVPIDGKDVDHWFKEIGTKGWLRMDWWDNIAQGSGVSGEDDQDDERDREEKSEEDEDEDEDEMKTAEKIRLCNLRAGTMKQDEFNNSTLERREQYAKWKEMMLAKIDDLVEKGVLDKDINTTRS